MNTEDRAQADLTADEINTLQYLLNDFVEKLKSSFQGGMRGYDEKLTLYNMLVINKKLQFLKRIELKENT